MNVQLENAVFAVRPYGIWMSVRFLNRAHKLNNGAPRCPNAFIWESLAGFSNCNLEPFVHVGILVTFILLFLGEVWGSKSRCEEV